MSEVFTNSGESSDITAGPPPRLQGLFIPGIDNSQFVDGFGMVIPWGGGNTMRKYGDYGISVEISNQSTQLNDIANNLLPAGGGISLNFEGLRGPPGPPGPPGTPGLPGLPGLNMTRAMSMGIGGIGWNLPTNYNFVAALPHNIDQINALGTAGNKLIYTDSFGSYYSEFIWTERQPAGDVNADWECLASDSDGSHLIAGVEGGRLYTSADSGVTWTERRPAGDANANWTGVASDADGSHLMAGISRGRLYTSADYGVSWSERQPRGDDDWDWKGLASDSDGSNLIAGQNQWQGKLYTSSNYGSNWTERQAAGEGPDDFQWEWSNVASDDDGSHLMACVNGKRLFTSSDSGSSWTERQPAGDVDKNWWCLASDSDGSHLVVGEFPGRLYTSSNSGTTWTERQPAGAANKNWHTVASDSDGSNIIVSLYGGRIYTSGDSGVTWTDRQPTGDENKNWQGVALDADGTNFILGIDSGRLYTGTTVLLYQEATWGEADLTSAGIALLADSDAASQATTLGLGTGDAVTHDTLTLSSIAAEGTDVDKFLVDSSGVIKYRTGAQVLSDIGASASAHNHAGVYEPADAGLTSLAALSYVAASFIKMTGANTFALRTIGETADDLQGTIDHNLLANYAANRHFLQSGITAVGTIAAGIWEGTSIAVGYTDAKCVAVWPDTYTADQNLLEASSPIFAGLAVTDLIKFDDTYSNTLLGTQAGNNSNGQYNLFVGYQTGYNNDVTGVFLEGDRNVYMGFKSGYGNTAETKNTGYKNVGIGMSTLRYNTSGHDNMTLGASALYSNTEGSCNLAIGSFSGWQLTLGSSNVFLGFYSGSWQTENSNLLIIDNQDRGSAANELAKSLIYGIFAPAAADQSLRINAAVHMPNLKSGTDQANAGAAANELYHDTDDNTIKIGV